MLRKKKSQINIKVAAEIFFDDFQVGLKLSVSAIENDDEYRNHSFSDKHMARDMDQHSLPTVKVETKIVDESGRER